MQLTEHFSLEELTFSSTAVARGIDNAPAPTIVEHLRVLAQGLEQVRAILNAPMKIDSGFRCVELNAIVRGVPTSAHLSGFAADFVCPAYGSPIEIVKKLTTPPSVIEFDQLIQEGTWVHISFAPTMRNEVLTAHFRGGKATYSRGV
jgi:hypothetical protein